jgi:hypothetical protein
VEGKGKLLAAGPASNRSNGNCGSLFFFFFFLLLLHLAGIKKRVAEEHF